MINLSAVSRMTAGELTRNFARPDVAIIPNAVDLAWRDLTRPNGFASATRPANCCSFQKMSLLCFWLAMIGKKGPHDSLELDRHN